MSRRGWAIGLGVVALLAVSVVVYFTLLDLDDLDNDFDDVWRDGTFWKRHG